MHENRETSGAPRPARERGRSAKAQSHTADAHALEESDRAILSMNQTNKEVRSSAESGEKRARAKENIVQSDRKSTRLNSSHLGISYAVFCLKKKKQESTVASRVIVEPAVNKISHTTPTTSTHVA